MSEAQWRFAERYDLLGQLGSGAVGAVWLVRDQQTAAEYAIKILRPELTSGPEAAEGLRVLLDSVGRLAHPNIVAVDEVVAHEGKIALVMRPVPGEDLRVLLNRMGVLAPSHAALLVAQLCDALAAAHAVDVSHGGVKPSNVLLEPLHDEAGSLLVCLTDFGMSALAAAAGVTPLADVVGQAFYSAMPVEYQAPEIGFGVIGTPAADVYATGVLLYETLAGHTPFTGPPEEVLRLHREGQPPRIPALPDPLWLLVAACLDKHPQHRPSAVDLASLLREIAPTLEAIPAWVIQGAPGTVAPAVPVALEAAGADQYATVVQVLPVPAVAVEAGAEGSARASLTGPRRMELIAVVTVVVLAFTLTLLFASIGSGPRPNATLAANPSVPVTAPSASITLSGVGQLFPSDTATASASASASASPSASPTPHAPSLSPSAAPPPVKPPTSPAAPSTVRTTSKPPVDISWQCSDNTTSGGIDKRSCIGLGSDGMLYIQGAFTAPPGQDITDIKLTLNTGRWTYTTVTKSCGGNSCNVTAGPYDPPPGYYWNVAGINGSSHNETSPPESYGR